MVKHGDQGNLRKSLFRLMVPEGEHPSWQGIAAAGGRHGNRTAENSYLRLQVGSTEAHWE